MASNSQFGTNTLSASDWIRMKKLTRIINGTTKQAGSSNIRSPASDVTDVIAASRGTFITRGRNNTADNVPNTPYLVLNQIFCTCYNDSYLKTKIAECRNCSKTGAR
jgi:hypothetical protein